MTTFFDFSPAALAKLAQTDVARALEEDLGSADLTAGLVDPTRRAKATIIAREAAVICGQAWVQAAFQQVDPAAEIIWHVSEGHRCQADQVILEVHGLAHALLTAERTALNFLQLLSAVATKTSDYVQAIREVPSAHASIVDTRKTLPGLRLAQKYAVRTGGGVNHRLGLYDAVLIKENHIAAAGGVAAVLRRAAQVAPAARFVEIEVETLAQLQEALDAGATMVLLDNMGLAQLHEAVHLNAGRAQLEVSGGVNLSTLRAIAATGVDRISIGTLTKDIKAIDFSMRFAPTPV
ncbi:carboxylating nicotinate-nucleotide diphosphorylase [Rhodoferax sp.]|uniref:carboxylating nicotinate-nucleotide diphosphorylase n=1 Tax=Rhodoferax sp. TaxID=50421 RepID=UPI002611ADC1|nr:carboxylating nicotinate-nucleotide diphosphorylase [Rhodoferax sp.]MDD2926112.1 carboxylating nicotinate-nucleotide diphosphorylase [Rhodoferax sp.]